MIPLKENERFGGIARLYGQAGLLALNKAHICVVGVGGVGSWTVEALARSGVGALTLVDLDEVCVSNVNRQLQALDGSFGKFKVEELKNRISNIFPLSDDFSSDKGSTVDFPAPGGAPMMTLLVATASSSGVTSS